MHDIHRALRMFVHKTCSKHWTHLAGSSAVFIPLPPTRRKKPCWGMQMSCTKKWSFFIPLSRPSFETVTSAFDWSVLVSPACEDTNFHLLPLPVLPPRPDLSSSYLLGWGEVRSAATVQSYKQFWAQNATCCRHCTTKTQRPFDMSQLWTGLICLVTTVCVQTLAERQTRHTHTHAETQKCIRIHTHTNSSSFVSENPLCICSPVCFGLSLHSLLSALSNCSVK